MRYCTISGIDDHVYINLGGDVSIISEVIQIGEGEDSLIYKATMTGAELLVFLRKFHMDSMYGAQIHETNRYVLTAYDW